MAQGAWEPEPTAPEATVRSRSPPKREVPTCCVAQGTALIFFQVEMSAAGGKPTVGTPEIMSLEGDVCSKEDNPATRNTRAERDMKMLWCVR